MFVCLVILTRDFLGFRLSSSSLKKSLHYSYPLTPTLLIGLAYSSFDKIFLNKLTGLTSVGYYTFGARFAALIKMVMTSVDKVFGPFFLIKAHQNTDEAKKEIIERFYELSFLFMFSGFVIICFSEEMIKLLTTEEYYPSMYVIPAYVYYYLFAIPSILANNQRMFVEKLYYEIPLIILSLIINIVLNILLIPKFGAVGAAIATAIAALCGNALGLYYGLRLYPLPLQISKLAGLYILILVFTGMVYPTMAIEINFMLKIVIKLLLIFLFAISCIKLNYISSNRIRNILNRIFYRGFKLS
jgi:O-antigen/teichoic acid export membrane protein